MTDRRAGRCTVHNDLAWLYADGSIACFYCVAVETTSQDCVWEPMPDAWIKET